MTRPAEPRDVESLERARARQLAAMRPLRVVGIGAFLLVEVAGIANLPHPGLAGRGLGVLLALIAVAAGFAGATSHVVRLPIWVQALSYALLIGGSAALISLQPSGAGILGCYFAVAAAALRLPPRLAAAVGVCGVVALTIAEAVFGHQSPTDFLIEDSGLAAFYALGVLALRLREGQDRAIEMALELEETHRAKAEALTLAERQRLAREMHDVLAHSLSGLVLQLEGARVLAERTGADAELSAVVDRALHLGKAGLAEARRAIGTLRDDQLPGPELVPALVTDFERDSGVRCTLQVRGEERSLDPVARLTVYRVAQEALTNIRRHSRAESAALHLTYEPGGLRLLVEDVAEPVPVPAGRQDGAAPGGGYGITGMRERAELLGGHLDAGPTDRGFRVELWLPG